MKLRGKRHLLCAAVTSGKMGAHCPCWRGEHCQAEVWVHPLVPTNSVKLVVLECLLSNISGPIYVTEYVGIKIDWNMGLSLLRHYYWRNIQLVTVLWGFKIKGRSEAECHYSNFFFALSCLNVHKNKIFMAMMAAPWSTNTIDCFPCFVSGVHAAWLLMFYFLNNCSTEIQLKEWWEDCCFYGITRLFDVFVAIIRHIL